MISLDMKSKSVWNANIFRHIVHIPNQMEDAEKVEQAKLGKCIRMHLEIFKKAKATLFDSLQEPCCILVYILESR